MFTVQQYREKADEYASLLKSARSTAEATEYRELQKSYSSLAENLDWLAVNAGKTVAGNAPRFPNLDQASRRAERVHEEKILRCLGAAVVLNWNMIPTSVQRTLFEAASFTPDIQTESLRDALAKFLHDHKDDAQRDARQPTRSNATRLSAPG
jgi:hypothetical protein